jgi:NTE family protein
MQPQEFQESLTSLSMQENKPKIGLALSGGFGRAVGHIAVLEVFKKHNIPLHVITACSSGSIVAAAYGAGTLDFLKEVLMNFTFKEGVRLLSPWGARGGMIQTRKADPLFNKITGGLRFEDLPLKMGFTASDIRSGELVTITHGELLPAIKAGYAVPGIFEPGIMGQRVLLDGGLFNVMPTLPAKQLGADIVIGVDTAISKFLYQRKFTIWRMIRRFRRMVRINRVMHDTIKTSNSKILSPEEIDYERRVKVPSALRIFFWAVDHSFDVEKEWKDEQRDCDVLIEPEVKDLGRVGISKSREIYEIARQAAEEAVPKIKELISNYEKQHQPVKEKVT